MNENQQPYNGKIDEALLTAFALDELEGPERALVEAALKTDRKAQEAVEEIREVAGCLRDAATHDEDFAPSASLREMIEARLEGMVPVVEEADVAGADVAGADVAGADVVGADVVGEGDSPIFAETKIGTVPGATIGTVPGRRRWAILAVASAAVLLLAVTIPSLQMFRQATTSDVAMEMVQKSPAPAADSMALGEPTAARPESDESEEASMVEAKEAVSSPLDAAAGVRLEAADSVSPAEELEGLRSYDRGAAMKSAAAPALAESSPHPVAKGAARYMDDQPKREDASGAVDKRPSLPAVAGKAAEKPGAMTRSIAPKPAPTAPMEAWSHRQAAGPAATPVPYPGAAPTADGEIPLAQSQMMPRAKSAGQVPELDAAPTPEALMPTADPFAAPAIQAPSSLADQIAPEQQVEMLAQPAGIPREANEPTPKLFKGPAPKQKPQKPQPAESSPTGPGSGPGPAYGEGMGYGGGMGGYGPEAGQSRGEGLDYGALPPAPTGAPARVPLQTAPGGGTIGESESVTSGLQLQGRRPGTKKALLGAYGGTITRSGRGYGEQAEGEDFSHGYSLAPQAHGGRPEEESLDAREDYADEMRRSRGRVAGQQPNLGTEQYAPRHRECLPVARDPTGKHGLGRRGYGLVRQRAALPGE